MYYRLIMLENPVIISNEEIKVGDIILGGDEKIYEVKSETSNDEYVCYIGDQYIGNFHKRNLTTRKVIAQSHQIDWNGLEKEFGYVDVEALALEWTNHETKSKWAPIIRDAFIEGYRVGKGSNNSQPIRCLIEIEMENVTGSALVDGYVPKPKFTGGKIKILKKLWI